MAHLIHNRYDVGDKIGEGGMGVVYRATDTRLGRPVALKVVHERLADSASARARLIREAQVAASLNHPNICTIYEVFELDRDQAGQEDATRIGGGPVIVLELIEGETLHAQLARTGRLPLRELVDVAVQIADGLAEAHQRQIIHRDLKPQNVFVTRGGRVKILDFGLARAVPQAAGPEAATVRLDTVTGDAPGAAVKGTVPYMSPEQATGRRLDSRSDVFSFGIMLYEMAGGRRPFRGDTSVEVLARILEAEPPSLGDLRPELPPALERIVQRCLRKAPDDRYHDTRDLLADLREVQDALRTSSERRAPVSATSAPFSRNRKGLIVGSVVAVAGLAIFAIYWRTRPAADSGPPVTTHKQLSFVGDASFPTISPDGNFVAYVRGEPWGRASRTLEPLAPQKIIVQDLAGGGRLLEVAECRVCASLSWAPDSTSLLASDGRQLLHVPRLGGTVRRFVGGAMIAWAPGGAEIATTSFGGRELIMVHPSGNELRRVPLRWDAAAARGLDWSPNGGRLAVVSAARDNRHSIWLVSPDGQTQDKVFEDAGAIGSVKWSPAGNGLLFMRAVGETFDLWRLPLTSGTGPAAGEATAVMTGVQAGPNFSIARDGTRLLYTREAHYSNLWAASVDAARRRSPLRQLTTGTSRDQFPAVSPDGTRIAFIRGEGAASNVYVMPLMGGPPQQLTLQMSVIGAPAWSPDGKRLGVCATASSINSIWSVDLGTGQAKEFPGTRCTTTISEIPVMWAPRREILYQRSGNRNYFVFDPDSSIERPLIKDDQVGWLFGPRSSPDGSTLAAFWNRKDGSGVWLIPSDGSAPSLILRAFAWPLGWSSDGKTIHVYVHAPTTDIVTISRSGGVPVVQRALTGQRISLVPAISPDGRTVIYAAYAMQSDLWQLEGFERR